MRIAPLVPVCLALGGCGLALGLGDFTDDAPGPTSGSGPATGVGGATSSSSTGGGGSCSAGETRDCYDFPTGMPDVGQCVGGTQTCTDGEWGACVGEVGPADAEDCATAGDEDCDGAACGDVVWASEFGDTDSEAILALAVAGDGSILVAGDFAGTMTIGNDTLVSAGDRDVWIAKLAPDGAPLWAKRFGDALYQGEPDGFALDGAGHMVVAGEFRGTIDFGLGPMAPIGGNNNIYVVCMDLDGNPLWNVQFGGGSNLDVGGVAYALDGNPVIVGGFAGSAVNFGGGTLASLGIDVFAVKLASANGGTLWRRSFGESVGMLEQTASAVAISVSGNVKIVGHYEGDLTFGSTHLFSQGATDAFMGTLDTDGTPLGLLTFGDDLPQSLRAIGIDASGKIVLVGDGEGATAFGAAPALTVTTSGPGDLNPFVAALSPQGTGVWARGWGDANIQNGRALAIGTDDTIAFAGPFRGTIDFGTGPLTNTGIESAYVAKLTSAGDAIWARKVGGQGDSSNLRVAVDPNTNEVVAGLTFSSDLTVDAGHVFPGHGPTTDFAVIKYQP